MTSDSKLKKYHFWILFGVVPLFVLIAAVLLSSSVGGAIDQKEAEIKKAQTDVAGKSNVKPEALVEKLDKQIELVKKKKFVLWEENWNRQKGLFTWPQHKLLKEIERLELKFGAPIPNDRDQYELFKNPEVYLAEFSTAAVKNPSKLAPGAKGMVEMIAPTQFAGGWERVLRHVNAFPEQVLRSEQIWLMLEDIWVQRSLLDAIRSVNAKLAEFRRVRYERDGQTIDDPSDPARQNPLRRRFEGRVWAVELEVVELPVDDRDNPLDPREAPRGARTKRFLTGRLFNQTDRLQLMGLGNTMVLNVWLDPARDAQPFEFRIGGEFLPGVGATRVVRTKTATGQEIEEQVPANVLTIAPTKDHIIPPTTNVVEIARVEQRFDTRTVPVRRIEGLALSYPDSRHARSQLKPPSFYAPKEGESGTDTGSGGFAGPVGGYQGSLAGPPGGTPPGPMGPGGRPGDYDEDLSGRGGYGPGVTAAGGGQKWGGGPLDAVITQNKKRYIDVTNEVRRMPVAVSVIVDQAYLQDVLLAFTNSPLRFQITQVTWSRFRGNLGEGGGGSNLPGGGDVVYSGQGYIGSDFRSEVDPDLEDRMRYGRGPVGPVGPPRPGLPGPGGSSIGLPPGMGPGLPSPGGPPFGPPGMGPGLGPGPGGYGESGPGGYYGSPGGLSTVSESQLTSGLIQLDVYGIVSLYEKYQPEAAGDEVAKEPKDAKEPKEVKEPQEGKGLPNPTGARDPKGAAGPKDAGRPQAPDAPRPGGTGTDPKTNGGAKEGLPPPANGPKTRRVVRRRR